MQFAQFIKCHITPILSRYGFLITKEYENIIQYESSVVKLTFAYNRLEDSYFIGLGDVKGFLYPLSGERIKKIYDFDFPMVHISFEKFVEKLILFLNCREVQNILLGDIGVIRNDVEIESRKYTQELINSQLFQEASWAWEHKDYEKFIRKIDELGIENVSKSWQLKYAMAVQKYGFRSKD